MASYTPPPPGGVPPPFPDGPNGPNYPNDPRAQKRAMRDQMRYYVRAQRDAERAQRYEMRSRRRGSVVGPLLLIAIGVVFLLIQTGRLPHDSFWSFYARWWPMVIVAAGLILLAEWAFDQRRLRDPQQVPYRRTAGFWTVFLLCILASAGFTANYSGLRLDGFPWQDGWHIDEGNLEQFLGNKHESDQALDLDFAPGTSIFIDNPRGDVTLTGSSEDGRIHVQEHTQVFSSSDSESLSKAQQLRPRVSPTSPGRDPGGSVSITVPSINGGRADLTVTAPPGDPVRVTANHGDVHVSSVKADVSATANHGDIALSSITGSATAHINNGSSSISAHSVTGAISVEGRAEDVTLTDIRGTASIRGEFFGTTQLERIAGAVHFHTSRTDFQLGRLDGGMTIHPGSGLTVEQAVGPVLLTTRDRNITFDRVAGDILVANRNGTVDVTAAPQLGKISIDNRNGAVKLTLPEQASFTLQAGTTNGKIDDDFAFPMEGSSSHRTMNGAVGNGGPAVHVATTNFDVSIRRAAVAPLAPLAPRLTLMPELPVPPERPQPPAGAEPPKTWPKLVAPGVPGRPARRATEF